MHTGSSFVQDLQSNRPSGQLDFYDSVTGAVLFSAPRERSLDDFLEESLVHGWPSFRDQVRSTPVGLCMHLKALYTFASRLCTGGALGERARSEEWRDGVSDRHAPGPQPARQPGQPLLHQPRQHRGAAGHCQHCQPCWL